MYSLSIPVLNFISSLSFGLILDHNNNPHNIILLIFGISKFVFPIDIKPVDMLGNRLISFVWFQFLKLVCMFIHLTKILLRNFTFLQFFSQVIQTRKEPDFKLASIGMHIDFDFWWFLFFILLQVLFNPDKVLVYLSFLHYWWFRDMVW